MTVREPVREMAECQVDPRGHQILQRDWSNRDPETGEYPIIDTAIFSVYGWNIDGVYDPESEYISCFTLSSSCGLCDEWITYERSPDGTKMQPKTACAMPDGLITTVEIDVPSGKLLCDDDLRDAPQVSAAERMDEEGMASYNSTLGQSQVVKNYAEIDLAFGPCLNTCPSLYEIEPGKYVVANGRWDDDVDDIMPPSTGGKEVANFCTDLWAFSMMDYEKFLAAGGPTIEDQNQYGTRTIIEIPPGRYRMTYHAGERSFDYDGSGEQIFAEFERISE